MQLMKNRTHSCLQHVLMERIEKSKSLFILHVFSLNIIIMFFVWIFFYWSHVQTKGIIFEIYTKNISWLYKSWKPIAFEQFWPFERRGGEREEGEGGGGVVGKFACAISTDGRWYNERSPATRVQGESGYINVYETMFIVHRSSFFCVHVLRVLLCCPYPCSKWDYSFYLNLHWEILLCFSWTEKILSSLGQIVDMDQLDGYGNFVYFDSFIALMFGKYERS